LNEWRIYKFACAQTATETLNNHKELKTILGDYIVTPDIIIGKEPLEDINLPVPKPIHSLTDQG
jgi:hypothetical protein